MLSNGCPETRLDAAAMQELLRANGWAVNGNPRRADLVVFSACGGLPHTQEHSLRIVRRLARRKRPGAKLVVCGCLSMIRPDLLRQVYGGPTCGPDELDRFATIVGARPDPAARRVHHVIAPIKRWHTPELLKRLACRPWAWPLARRHTAARGRSLRPVNCETCCIKVATGCLHRCSFCGIRLARGRIRSRPINEVVAEVEACLAEGHRGMHLVATDLGAYGRDRDTTLSALLRQVLAIPGDFTLALRNVQPYFLCEMRPEIPELFGTGRISLVLSGALSGSNRILRLMRRGYRIEEFTEAASAIKRSSPRTRVVTQIIVGFPGETEEEFDDSVRLVRDGPFDAFVPYAFEATPGTEAAGLPDPLPQRIVASRYRRIARVRPR